jgi:hypothetical protein
VGSDDESKLYLNGKEIYRNGRRRSYIPDQDAAAAGSMKSGINVVVLKVVNSRGDWKARSGSPMVLASRFKG